MWFRACLIGFCLVDYAQAAYGPEDLFKLTADLAYQYDSNLFKLDEDITNAQTNKHGKRADSKIETRLGGSLDLVMSRQLVHVVVGVNQINYLNFTDLNHNEWNANLVWDWVVGSIATGQLRANTSTRMSSFEDNSLGSNGNSALDMQKQDSINWQGALQLKSTVAIIATAMVSTEQHDVKKYIDAKSNMVSLGMRYSSKKGNYISAQHSWRKYTYDQDLPFRAGFTEQISSLDMAYAPSSKIDLNMSLGMSHWVSAFNDESQYTPQGDLGLLWRVTDKTQLKLSYGKSFAEFTSGAGRNLDQHVNFNARWSMSEKINWNLDLNQRDRSFEVAGSNSSNEETTNSLRLGMGYKVLRQLTINSYLQTEKRDSSLNNSDYKYYQVGLNATLVY
ncbi:outer membrane beta-barrel protein [Iodobacter sp. CM08]|uniref:outer membrane beta-barrel protein n=1 Tax=Iodobacter sp. CM08 TaxID=3085902 RepID=UPI00298179CA|nr:outer membrane beta-barrel protein [Iodobacter sp. CM08]MDW5416671.1 outer membrane beta-barrel protein [Iodobacter sp. CM08]